MNITTSYIQGNDKDVITNILGVIGTIFTMSIYTPQIFRSFKKKKVEISWSMLGLEIISDIIWICYYYLNEIYYPILTGVCILIFASFLCFMKLYYRKQKIECKTMDDN
jgi:uncharacterized protein with PQ loop repeat